jgi:hypothetical protein
LYRVIVLCCAGFQKIRFRYTDKETGQEMTYPKPKGWPLDEWPKTADQYSLQDLFDLDVWLSGMIGLDPVNRIEATASGPEQDDQDEAVPMDTATRESNKGSAAATGSLPPGLLNFDNGCFNNSTVKAMHSSPPIRQWILEAAAAVRELPLRQQQELLVAALADVFRALSSSGSVVVPWASAVRVLTQRKGDNGQWVRRQQDSEEAFSRILQLLHEQLTEVKDPETKEPIFVSTRLVPC